MSGGAKGNAKNRASTLTIFPLGCEEGRGVVTPKLRTFLFGIARPFSTFGRIGKHPEHPDLEVGGVSVENEIYFCVRSDG